MDDSSDADYANALNKIDPLDDLISEYVPEIDKKDVLFMKEFILWALVELEVLNKKKVDEGVSFQDKHNSYIAGI